jgi:F-type H+-transporting ATPase subunit b
MVTRLLTRTWFAVIVTAAILGPRLAYGEKPAADDGTAESAATVAEANEDHPAKHKEEGGAEALNPINFHGMNFPGDMALWTGVVFVVVLLILWKFAWRPIADGLGKRESQIADQISQAERSNEEARRLLAEYQQKLAASQDDVRGILEQGRRDAERVGHELIEKAKGEAAAERDRAVQQIETATTAALKELADRSATLAVELAGKILHAKLNPADHSRLIKEAVANFASQSASKN